MTDAIHIEELELSAHIGVPDEERAVAQRLTASLVLEPVRGFDALGDDLAQAVDYFAVCQAVRELVAERPRRLIETLAEEIARGLLARFRLSAVEVEIRKYILPDTKYVSVRVRRGN
jgi:dihydroneopterin aldolase